ncbi:MAG: 5-formyltetrahydrofolate cyclo-ligase [Alphaproteobacteria bacterium]|nr:5-formyltetrahydrofolate cyclo-ligase [Alphaproteobacteria bacterium]MDX5417153.1 5-formyltetrahydrofolate cyclo-ligase [Alphaproteobacteria bacterium]MDX5494586.1 5-formyltetrahydrofolate cyclo-ligase [Alphaproteobacteria bacterium]
MSASSKHLVREAAKRRREEAHAALAASAPAAIASHFLAAMHLGQATGIAGYAAIGSEADPSELLRQLDAAGHVCSLPVVETRHAPLVFRRWRPGDALEPGDHGTRAPSPKAAVCRPQIVLVPLLAFDDAGRRLGYGGGYYDRTLAALRSGGGGVLAVGVAFSAQEAQDLPEDEFDERLDWIVTEKEARRFGAAFGR